MPLLSGAELRAMFLADVPEPVLEDTVRCLTRSYSDSARYCRDNFPAEEAHDLYAHHRRAMFERNWRGRLARYPGLKISTRTNASRTCYHTEVRAGRVLMTVSAVEAPFEVVRPAVFRQTLALDSQLNIFTEPEAVADDAPLYAIVLHGPLGGGLHRTPAFIHVGFPETTCSKYVDRFNLLDCFPVLQAEMAAKPVAPVERAQPRIRRERRRDEEPG
jgi:hypothetical protein